jgi:hypothetical protein
MDYDPEEKKKVMRERGCTERHARRVLEALRDDRPPPRIGAGSRGGVSLEAAEGVLAALARRELSPDEAAAKLDISRRQTYRLAARRRDMLRKEHEHALLGIT